MCVFCVVVFVFFGNMRLCVCVCCYALGVFYVGVDTLRVVMFCFGVCVCACGVVLCV